VIDHRALRRILLQHLSRRWPEVVTLEPRQIGLTGVEDARAFLKAIRELSEEGLLSYELLLADAQRPRAQGASITPRGRATISSGPAFLLGEQATRRW